MILTIELLTLLTSVVLMIHAANQYNLQFVALFWTAGMVMGILREIAFSGIINLYQYGNFQLVLFGVPLIFWVFWTNLAYIAWQWSNNFLDSEYLKAKPWDHNLPLIFLSMVGLSFFFEAFFSQYNLIYWKIDSIPMFWGQTPLMAPFAYGYTTLVFMSSLKILSKEASQAWQILSLKLLLAQPLVILAILGLLLITNLGIILVFS
ncbi:MAG: hypothetical protein HQ508_02645 [Candidatus Marinimicrobia bacterium]|nr:hypothetical protein [Candidatus Neomarinimicrobiota bacterium]